MPIMLRRLTLTGSTLRPRSVEEKAAIARDLRAHVWPRLETEMKVVIHHVCPLADAAAAHRMMEESQHVGKILLRVR